MPQKSAAKKYLRVTKKRHQSNLTIKNKLKTAIKKTRVALEDPGASAKVEELLKEAVKIIDRATQKKVIKKNTAARKKKRLFKRLRISKEKNGKK